MSTAYCFDLDGTITKDEILPVLSREVELFEEIGALTEATIKGVIPFQKSFLLRCRLLREIPLSRVQEIVSNIRFNEEIADFIRQNQSSCYVITGNLDVWIKPLLERLGCKFYSSHAEVIDGALSRVTHVINKGEAIEEIKKNHEHIIAIGDGMGDVQMFERADTGIAYGGTHRPIQTLIELSDYVTFSEKSLCRLLNTL